MSGFAKLPTSRPSKFANAAEARLRRLNKPPNAYVRGMLFDLFLGAGPWIVVMLVICGLVSYLYTEVSGAAELFSILNVPAAISSISTFAGFLLVNRLSLSLNDNQKIIFEFQNLAGSAIDICILAKSQIASGKTVEFLTLSDGRGGFFRTTRLALACSSLCYIVKYRGRGAKIIPEGLPLGQDQRLLQSYKNITSAGNGSRGVNPFPACMLIIAELIDELCLGQKPSEYAALMSRLNSAAAAEGAIAATASYVQPYLIGVLLWVIYILYFFLLACTELVPEGGFNSLWTGAIISFCTISFYSVSERYRNPMKLRSRRAGQTPIVSTTCSDAEIAITSVFSRPTASLAMSQNQALPDGAGIKFSGLLTAR